MTEILQTHEAQLTTEQLLQIMAEERRIFDAERLEKYKRWDAILGVSREPEKEAEPGGPISLEKFPIVTLTGTSLSVEAFGEVDSPLSNSSENVTVEASIVPALEPGFPPLWCSSLRGVPSESAATCSSSRNHGG